VAAAATGGDSGAADGSSQPTAKKEDPLAAVKAALDAQMRRPPYKRFAEVYDKEDFSKAKFASLVPWGKDQTFSGLVHRTSRSEHTPHGWGVLEHHEGFLQACSLWYNGYANGPGMWAQCVDGKEQCGYGTWVEGKRNGYFALVKEGGVFIEEYANGELKRRIKWRKDKLHLKCIRCNMLFVESANDASEKFCRFHPKKSDKDGRFPCCGALQSLNPRGCCTSMHVEPGGEASSTGLDDDVDVALAALGSVSIAGPPGPED